MVPDGAGVICLANPGGNAYGQRLSPDMNVEDERCGRVVVAWAADAEAAISRAMPQKGGGVRYLLGHRGGVRGYLLGQWWVPGGTCLGSGGVGSTCLDSGGAQKVLA